MKTVWKHVETAGGSQKVLRSERKPARPLRVCEVKIFPEKMEDPMEPNANQPAEDPKLVSLRRRLCHQAADLVNLGKIHPGVVAGEFINVAVGVALSQGVPPGDLAAILRRTAAAADDGQDFSNVVLN